MQTRGRLCGRAERLCVSRAGLAGSRNCQQVPSVHAEAGSRGRQQGPWRSATACPAQQFTAAHGRTRLEGAALGRRLHHSRHVPAGDGGKLGSCQLVQHGAKALAQLQAGQRRGGWMWMQPSGKAGQLAQQPANTQAQLQSLDGKPGARCRPAGQAWAAC